MFPCCYTLGNAPRWTTPQRRSAMPISILLIESDHHHAQAVVDALADPWSGWRVDVAQSLAQARDHLEHSRPDIVLAAQRSVDGSAFDLLRLLDGVPAMIIVRKELMSLTQSAFGLVGQVQRAADGHPFLRVHAMTDISWDEASHALYAQHA